MGFPFVVIRDIYTIHFIYMYVHMITSRVYISQQKSCLRYSIAGAAFLFLSPNWGLTTFNGIIHILRF